MTRPELLRDAAPPAAVFALGAVEMVLVRWDGWGAGVLLEGLACLLLVWRRRHPLVMAPAAGVVVAVMPWVGPQLDEPSVPILVLAVCCYSLARWPADLRGLAGTALIGLVLLLDYLLVDARSHSVSDLFFVVALMTPPFVFGRVARRLADQTEQLRERQEWVRQEAVRAERDRIARDLHDVVAHSVSAMVVQTAAAQDLVRTDPDRAERVLADVAATGRRALAETGRLLHVVRDDAGELGLAPTPGLDRLAELVESFRQSGLRVDLVVEGPGGPLPVGVDVSAYRIVQEALTNALKYAAGRTTSLRLDRSAEGLSIRSENATGHGTVGGSGLGLVGIAERVSVFGGTLRHGPTGDGRYVLVATLPVPVGEPG